MKSLSKPSLSVYVSPVLHYRLYFFFVVGVEVDLFEVFRLFAGTDFLDAFCFRLHFNLFETGAFNP